MRLKVLLGAAVASIFMVFAASATAGDLRDVEEFRASQDLDEPLNTNIPYLGWLGEELRLVKCWAPQADDDLTAEQLVLLRNLDQFQIDVNVITWSGDPFFKPVVETSSINRFRGTGRAHEGDPCVRVDVYSSKPGLGQIELDVNIPGFREDGSSTFDKHTFLVGWMRIFDLNIDELSCTEFGAPVDRDGECVLSDPLGDGDFGDEPGFGGRVRADVRGIIPTGSDSFDGLFDDDNLILPDEYREMANVLAEDSLPNTDSLNDIARWDIHDDELTTEGHIGPPQDPTCVPDVFSFDQNPDTLNDAVDNCGNVNIFGNSLTWSNIFNDDASGTGPFDPTSPATLVSNGVVDADDTPFPSIRLDFTASGLFASFRSVGKREIYRRNRLGNTAAHNLYAPYYKTWLPATEREAAEASGVAGPRHLNNAEGFLDGGREDDQYIYWRFADVLTPNDKDEECLVRDPDFLAGAGDDAEFREIEGPRRVAVYTDEHGVAYIDVDRNSGISNIPEANINENGGCDITGLPLTATISAVAKYPYKSIPGFRDGVAAVQTLPKRIDNLFQKGISCRPKLGPGVPNIFVCTVFVIDYDGTVGEFPGEVVCMTTGVGVDDVALDDDFEAVPPPAGLVGRNLLCTTLNEDAQAIFEPEGSGNVNALFVEEELKRVTTLGGTPAPLPDPGDPPVEEPDDDEQAQPDGVTPTVVTPVVQLSNNTQANNPGAASVSAVVVSLAGAPVPSAAAKPEKAAAQPEKTVRVARATLRSAKLVSFKGKRVLVVRVTSTAKAAKIQLRLINKAGKVTRVVRTVKTNKVVRVPNLVIARGITRVSISVLN